MSQSPPETNNHSVRFNFGESDAAAIAHFMFDREPEIRRAMGQRRKATLQWILLVCPILAFAGNGVGALIVGSDSRLNVGAIAGLLLGVQLSYRALRAGALRRSREMYVAGVLARLDSSSLGEHRTSLSSDGIVSHSPTFEGLLRWRGIDEVVRKSAHVFIAMRSRHVYAIPLQAFPSDSDASAFVDGAQALQGAAGETREDRILNYLAHNPSKCPVCGYDLTGASRATCPECGKVFDFDSPLPRR